MVAVVRIQDYKNDGVVVLPVNLVQKDEMSSYVYVAEKKGNEYVAIRKEITTGLNYGGNVEVLSGLNANDKVITAGYQSVNENQPVVFAETSLTQK